MFILEPGDVLFIPAGVSHAIDTPPDLDVEGTGVSIAASIAFDSDIDPDVERRFREHFPMRMRELRGATRMRKREPIKLTLDPGP